MPLAQPADVSTSLVRDLTPSEIEHVDALLTRAEALIEERVTDFSSKVGGDGRDESFITKVIHVTADAVARVFRNPGAYRQETEGNYSYTLDREAASGLLSISDGEWVRLGVQDSDFGSISTIKDGYAAARYSRAVRPDLKFQWGWPGDEPGMAEVIF